MATPLPPVSPLEPPLRFGACRPLAVRPVFAPCPVPATDTAAAAATAAATDPAATNPPLAPAPPVACVVPGFACAALCAAVVEACAESAWSAATYQFGTTDLEVDAHPRVRRVLRDAGLVPAVSDAMARAFGFRPSGFDDLFVVRYDAVRGQKELRSHQDGGDISFMLALSERSAYDGGGTRFAALGPDAPPLHLDQGHLVLFDASRFHEGLPVSRGIRILLVGFSYVGRAPGPGHLDTQLRRVMPPPASAAPARDNIHGTQANTSIDQTKEQNRKKKKRKNQKRKRKRKTNGRKRRRTT